jgi:hypothetical protein
MSISSLILAILALSLLGAAWKLSRLLADKQTRLIDLQQSLVNLLAEQRIASIKRAALLEQQKIVEQSVKTGAATAETVHKAVADVAFGVMDAIPVTEEVSKFARSLHNGIADTIYSTVRTSNKQIGGLAREYLKLKDDFDAARRTKPEREVNPPKAEESAQHNIIAGAPAGAPEGLEHTENPSDKERPGNKANPEIKKTGDTDDEKH